MVENNVVKKPNDWLVVNALNPNSSLQDFKTMAVQPENTGLEDQTYYKDLPAVKNMFKDKKGAFDEKAFDMFYGSLVKSYNDFSNEKYDLKNFTDNLIHSPYDFTVSTEANIKPYKVQISKIFNPTSQRVGVEAVGHWSESPFTMREIAQTQEVKNQKGVGLGFTPNDDDKSGVWDFLKNSLFGAGSQALAQWTEDGEHLDEFSEQSTTHKKGDYKYNEFGKPYYETLEGKTPVNRQMLTIWDTVTVDGSTQDKWNYMSSDDKEKTITGSILKATTRMLPYAIPGFGQFYAWSTAAMTLAEFGPQIGKMIGGFMSGDEFKNSDTYSLLNSMEGWSKSISASSVSDESMDKMWTFENVFSILPEVFIQLKEQRAIGNIPKYLGLTSADAKQLNQISKSKGPGQMAEVKRLFQEADKMGDAGEGFVKKQMALLEHDPELLQLYSTWVKNQNKVAKGLAIGYMTAASSGGVEEVVDQFDIGAKDGAWMKLGVLQAFWSSMSYFSFGDWQVQYAIGLDDTAKLLQKSQKTAAKEFKDIKLKEAIVNETENVVKKKFAESLKGLSGTQFFAKGKELGEKIASKLKDTTYQTSMIKEGLEEMSEETFLDGAKQVYNIFFDLGLTKNRDKKINWDNDEIFSRYALQGIGGALGGVLFHANDMFTKPIRENAQEQGFGLLATNMIRNGNQKEVYRVIDKIKNSNIGFASKNLSFSTFDKKEEDGNVIRTFMPAGPERLTQNEVIATFLTSQVKMMEKGIYEAKIPSDSRAQSVFSQRTNSLIDLGMHTAFKDDLNKLVVEYLDLYDKYNTLSKEDNNTDLHKKALSDLNLQVQSKKEEIKFLETEEAIGKYYQEALFGMDTLLSESYLSTLNEKDVNVEDVSQAIYKTDYAKLNDTQKAIVDGKISDLGKREKLRIAKTLFDSHAKLVQNQIAPVNEFLEKRKDIQEILKVVEYDFENAEEEVINQVPQYGKKGIKEFLNAPSLISFYQPALSVNPEIQVKQQEDRAKSLGKQQEAIAFYQQIDQLIDLYNTNPDAVSNEEYLLLQYLLKKLGNQNISFNELANDSFYDLVGQDYIIATDSVDKNDFFNDIKGYEGVTVQEEYKNSISKDAQLFLDPTMIFTPDIPNLSNSPYQYVKSKLLNNDKIILTDMQIKVYGKLIESNIKESHSFSQLETLLKALNVQYKTDPRNILNLIESERQRLLEKPLEEYILQSQVTLDEIKRQKDLLERLRVVIHQYIDFSVDPNTAIGYFPAINEYNKRNGILEEFGRMSTESAVPLFNYISHTLNRLDYLERLSINNLNNKIPNKEKQEIVMNVLQFREFLKRIRNIDAFKDLYEGQELDTIFTEKYEKKELADILLETSTEETENILKQIWDFESKVYELQQKQDQSFNDVIVRQLISDEASLKEIEEDVIHERFTEYGKHTNTVRKLDTLLYGMSIMFGDSKQFLKDYHILNNSDLKFAMFGDQQQQFKFAHHFIQSTIINTKATITQKTLLEAVSKIFSVEGVSLFRAESSGTIDGEPFLSNILSIYGIQGTGKTTLVLDFISKVLAMHGINSVGLAHTENIAENLSKNITHNLVSNPKVQNLDQLLNAIFGDDNYNKLKEELKKPIEDGGVQRLEKIKAIEAATFYSSYNPSNELIIKIIDNITKNANHDLLLDRNLISVILLDESTQIHSVIMQLLDQFITAYNSKREAKLTIITTGDWRQPGAIAKSVNDKGVEIYAAQAQQFFSLKSLDLNSSLRVDNNCKSFNSKNLSAFAERNSGLSEPNKTNKDQLTLKYYEKGEEFQGDKSVDYNEAKYNYEASLNRFIDLSKNKNKGVVIITDPTNKQLIQLGQKLNIDVLFTDAMNGVEYDYALIDIDLSDLSVAYNIYSKYINGALTRSRKGSYINKSAFDIFPNLQMIWSPDTTVYDIEIPKQKIEAYKEKRTKMINNLQKLLLGTDEAAEIKTQLTKQSNSATFVLGDSGKPKEKVSNDVVFDFLNNLGNKEEEKKEINPELAKYDLIKRGHVFPEIEQENNGQDGKSIIREMLDPAYRTQHIEKIRIKAKDLFVKNRYSNTPTEQNQLKKELIKYINDNVYNPVYDVELVLYDRKTIAGEKFVRESDIESTTLVYAIRLNLGQEKYTYLPLGVLSSRIENDEDKSLKAKLIDHFTNNGLINNGDDILLDTSKTLEFLSLPFNLSINNQNKVKLSDLRKKGLVVSKVFITRTDVDNKSRLKNDFFKNGREFVLVSSDTTLSPDELMNEFEKEIREATKNKVKADNDPLSKVIGLGSSKVRLVGLDRQGLKFDEWLVAISKSRLNKDDVTRKQLGDSWIAVKLFTELAKEHALLKEKLDKKETLTQEETQFFDFFSSMMEIMTVILSENEQKNLLTILKDASQTKKIVSKLEQLGYDESKKLFKPSHIFVYILQTALNGGTIYHNKKSFKLEPQNDFESYKDIKGVSNQKSIVEYITNFLSYDDSYFKNGIHYTAQFVGTNTAGESEQDWYGIQNLDAISEEYFNVSDVNIPDFRLPFDSKAKDGGISILEDIASTNREESKTTEPEVKTEVKPEITNTELKEFIQDIAISLTDKRLTDKQEEQLKAIIISVDYQKDTQESIIISLNKQQLETSDGIIEFTINDSGRIDIKETELAITEEELSETKKLQVSLFNSVKAIYEDGEPDSDKILDAESFIKELESFTEKGFESIKLQNYLASIPVAHLVLFEDLIEKLKQECEGSSFNTPSTEPY